MRKEVECACHVETWIERWRDGADCVGADDAAFSIGDGMGKGRSEIGFLNVDERDLTWC